MSDAATQHHLMQATNPGAKIRQQLETAKEMGLTSDDVRKLVQRFPERYRGLAVAMGVNV